MADEIVRSPCFECEDYHDCPYGEGKSWYHYGEVRYCPFQIIWLISNRHELEQDRWPDLEVDDNGVKSTIGHESYFVKVRVILGDLNSRLKKVNRDAREVLIEQIDRNPEIRLDGLLGISKSVLMYLKGFRRKQQTFAQWRRDSPRKIDVF